MSPLNLNPERFEGDRLRGNLRAIESHLTDDHYVRRFTPGDFTLDAAGVTQVNIPAATPRWPALEFADGVLARASASFEKPSEWRSGKFRARFWYTSPVGSTNNFQFGIRLAAVRGTEVLPGTDLLVLSTTYAGPAVANTVIKTAWIYSTSSLGADDELFTFQFFRDGANAADTNTNVLHVLYGKVEHIPAQRESQ